MEKVIEQASARFHLNSADLARWYHNLLIFTAPLLLVFVVELQMKVPMAQALIVLYIAFLNAVADLLRKFIAGNPSVDQSVVPAAPAPQSEPAAVPAEPAAPQQPLG